MIPGSLCDGDLISNSQFVLGLDLSGLCSLRLYVLLRVCLVVVVLLALRCRVLRACVCGGDLTPASSCHGDLSSNFQFVSVRFESMFFVVCSFGCCCVAFSSLSRYSRLCLRWWLDFGFPVRSRFDYELPISLRACFLSVVLFEVLSLLCFMFGCGCFAMCSLSHTSCVFSRWRLDLNQGL